MNFLDDQLPSKTQELEVVFKRGYNHTHSYLCNSAIATEREMKMVNYHLREKGHYLKKFHFE